MRTSILWILTLSFRVAISQSITGSSIFAHNDYAQANPFYGAYNYRVGFIEADVFLMDDQLFVAHFQNEILKERTLENLYLIPLQKEIIKNKSWAYPDSTFQLNLMIDLKTAGTPTLSKLVSQLQAYPEIVTCKRLEIFVSGNVPSPDLWDNFPSFIHFDGRPGVIYTPAQLSRITLISTSFRDHSKWDGKGSLPKKDQIKLEQVIASAHAVEKKIRFWGTPDFEAGWSTLIKLRADVIGTDNVSGLVQYLQKN